MWKKNHNPIPTKTLTIHKIIFWSPCTPPTQIPSFCFCFYLTLLQRNGCDHTFAKENSREKREEKNIRHLFSLLNLVWQKNIKERISCKSLLSLFWHLAKIAGTQRERLTKFNMTRTTALQGEFLYQSLLGFLSL